jgi:glutathione S-transferase
MLRLYDSRLSGNSWKVRILLSQLGIPYERITLDLVRGDTQDPAFRAKSRFARVPALELEDGRTIVESAAILMYLAQGTPLLPEDPHARAEVASWMFFEQADLQRSIGAARVYRLRGLGQSMALEIDRLQKEAYPALEKLDRWLQGRAWLVGDSYTLADLAVFAYVSLAHQGGFVMERFPAIAQWIARVKAQPGWVELLHGEPAAQAT